MQRFKDILDEFAGTLKNDYFDFEVSDGVEFKYQGEVYQGTITEIEDGKHGKVVVIVDSDEEDFQKPLLMHVSQLRKSQSKDKIKEIKVLKYV